MAAEAEASREARAKVIAVEGEQKASRSLKEASDVISDNPSALQLRYLQTLNQISAEKNSSIIFPVPVDLISNMVDGMRQRAGGDATVEPQRKDTKTMKLPKMKALG